MSTTPLTKKFAFQPQAHCEHSLAFLDAVIHGGMNDRAEFCGNPHGIQFVEQDSELNSRVLKGIAVMEAQIPQLDSKAAKVDAERGVMTITMNQMTESHAALYEMALGDQRETLQMAEKVFDTVRKFDGLDWSEFNELFNGGAANSLRVFAQEVLEGGCPVKAEKFTENLGGMTAAQFLAVPRELVQEVQFHHIAVGMMPSAVPEAFERDAKALQDAFMQELYAQDGMAHVLDEDGELHQPVNEDEYLSTVYIDVRGLEPERLANLHQTKIFNWARDFPAGIQISKGGPDNYLEEHLIGIGGDELDSPVDHLRLYAVNDSRVLVAKIGNDKIDRHVQPEVHKLLSNMDHIEASQLPVWLMDAPEHELGEVIDAFAHQVPPSVLAELRDEDGKVLITGARVLAKNGEYTDVYVTTSSQPYDNSANFFPVLTNGQAKEQEKAKAVEIDIAPSM